MPDLWPKGEILSDAPNDKGDALVAFNAWLDAAYYGVRLTDAEVNAMQAAFVAGVSLRCSVASAGRDIDVIGSFQAQWNEALEAAARVVDQCNHEGPYNAIGAASRIRALKNHAPTITTDEGRSSLPGAAAQGTSDTAREAAPRYPEHLSSERAPIPTDQEIYWACRHNYGRIVSADELALFDAGYRAARTESASNAPKGA